MRDPTTVVIGAPERRLRRGGGADKGAHVWASIHTSGGTRNMGRLGPLHKASRPKDVSSVSGEACPRSGGWRGRKFVHVVGQHERGRSAASGEPSSTRHGCIVGAKSVLPTLKPGSSAASLTTRGARVMLLPLTRQSTGRRRPWLPRGVSHACASRCWPLSGHMGMTRMTMTPGHEERANAPTNA